MARVIKFKRGLVPKNEIIGHAHKLGLMNEPSFIGADCCFIKGDGYLSFGQIGSPSWDNLDIIEISEGRFMKAISLEDL